MSTAAVEPGRGGATNDDLLGRLEALAAQLQAQSALIELQGEKITAQDAVIAQFTSGLPVPDVQPTAVATPSKLGRRGLMAGAAALLGAGIAKLGTAERVEAGHGAADSVSALHLGTTNSAPAETTLNVPSGINVYGLRVFGDPTYTIAGVNNGGGIAVYGVVNPPAGLQTAAGVYGTTTGTSGNGGGVVGTAGADVGVRGQSTTFYGVRGESTSHVGVGGISNTNWGMWGRSQTSYGVKGESVSGVGVFGISNSPSNAPKEGVRGESFYGPGVYGKSTNHAGVYSQGGGGNIALFGITATGTALAAQATNPAGQAALFLGNVNIIGNLTVSGSFPKSAGVPHTDGSVRRMYCMEAPESLFEDVGRGQLQGGKADIKLDPEFAALVTTDDYNVFLQPEGPTAGLYVSQRTATGFEVREQDADGSQGAPGTPGRERSVRPVTAASTVSFSYRVLAKRKDLVGKTRRLERIDLPRGVRRGGERGIMADTALLPPPVHEPEPDRPDRSQPHSGER